MKKISDKLIPKVTAIQKYPQEDLDIAAKIFCGLCKSDSDPKKEVREIIRLLDIIWDIFAPVADDFIVNSSVLSRRPDDALEFMRKRFTKSIKKFREDGGANLFTWVKGNWKTKKIGPKVWDGVEIDIKILKDREENVINPRKAFIPRRGFSVFINSDGDDINLIEESSQDLTGRKAGHIKDEYDKKYSQEKALKFLRDACPDLTPEIINEVECVLCEESGEFNLPPLFKRKLLLHKIDPSILVDDNLLLFTDPLSKRKLLLSATDFF